MKKNVASQVIGAQMTSATDGSAFTGTVTVYVTGDGGTQAIGGTGSGICTHEGNGFHTYVPTQAETNYDHVAFTFIGTGAIPATIQAYTTFPQTGDSYLGATAFAALQDQYDGTGLTGDTYPSTQSQVGRLATGAAAISVVAETSVLTIGTEVNTYASTFTLNGIYHQITSTTGALDVYYQFDVTTDGIAVDVKMNGRLISANDTIGVFAYNWVTSSWDQIGRLTGTGGTSDGVLVFDLLASHTGTGANDGKVRVRGYAASGLTSATLYLDWVYVSYSIVQSGLATEAKQDLIKAKTDQMVFTKANEMDVNTKSINSATVIGDGNATPWDGA